MSISRLILRLVLVIALLAVGYIAWRNFSQRDVNHYFNNAQAALRLGDRKAARTFLKKQIEKSPNHFEAHLALADLYLKEAEESGHSATYATNPYALGELSEAARCNPNDLALQHRFLKICLDVPYVEPAARAASIVFETEKDDADALFALLWEALERGASGYKDAETYLQRLEKVKSNPRPYQTARLKLEYLTKTLQPTDEVQKLFEETVAQILKSQRQAKTETATDAAPESMSESALAQDRLERGAMIELLVQSVQQATDGKSASERTTKVVDICEAMVARNRKRVAALPDPPPGNEKSEGENGPDKDAANKAAAGGGKVAFDREAAKQELGYYANLVSLAVAILNERFPPDPTKVSEKGNRERLNEQANKLRLEAIAAKVASPLVYHQAAVVAFSANKPEESLDILAQGLEASKKLPEASHKQVLELRLLAARQCIMVRKFDLAQQYIEPLFAEHEELYPGWAHLLRGAMHTARGAHELARDDYEKAQQFLGATPMVHMALANVYLSLKDWKNALEHLGSLQKDVADNNNPETIQWRRLQQASAEQITWGEFQAHLEMGNWKEALDRLKRLSESGNAELGPKAFVLAAQHFQSKNDVQAALQILSDGRKRFDKDLLITQSYAFLLHKLGKTAEATAEINRLAVANKDDVRAQLLLVRWLLIVGENQKALQVCDQLQPRFPKNPALLAMLAQSYLNADRPADAKAVADTLAEMPDGKRFAALIKLAVGLKTKDLNIAGGAIGELGDAVHDNINLTIIEAQLALSERNYEKAIDVLKEILDRTEVRDLVGQAMLTALLKLAEQKGPEVAEAKIESLSVKFPAHHYLLIARADLCFQQNKVERGLAALDELEHAEPTSPVPQYMRAVNWYKRGRPDLALEQLDKAIRLEPKHYDAIGLKARILLDKKDYEGAVKLVNAGLKLNAENKDEKTRLDLWSLSLTKIDAAMGLNNYDAAVQLAKELLATHPKQHTIRKRLAEAYEAAGKIKEAVLVYRLGSEESANGKPDFQTADADTFYLLSEEVRLLVRHKLLDEAQKRIATVVGASPAPDQCLGLADAFLASGEYALSQRWAEMALEKLPDNQKWVAHLLLGKGAVAWNKADPTKKDLLPIARQHLEEVVQLNPRHYEAANNLAYLLATASNDPERGLKIALALKGDMKTPDLPLEFIDTLSVCYVAVKRGADAENLLTDALRLHPESVMLQIRLAKVWLAMDKKLSARQQLEKLRQFPGLSPEQSDDIKSSLASLDSAGVPQP